MRSVKAIITLFIIIALLVVGCSYVDEPIEIEAIQIPVVRHKKQSQPQLIAQPLPAETAMENRFTDTTDSNPNAVESALMWSDKYDQLSEKYRELSEENINMAKERIALKKTVMDLEGQLSTTKRELDEANMFLKDMHIELTQWKGDVLGFRDEMRQSDGAQIQALTRILKVLGAELSEPVAMNTSAPVQ